MKKLYVFRGLPGSGKSTLANKLAALVVEPDMFRYDADKNYVFSSAKNDEVYFKTNQLLRFAMEIQEIPCLAVSATNVTLDNFRGYVLTGLQYGYEVIVVECYGNYGNVHNVPPAVVAKMRREFEPLTDEAAKKMRVSEVRRIVPGPVAELSGLERWIVTCCDYGDTCDGKPRVLAVCRTDEEAAAYIKNDIEDWADQRAGEDIEVDFDRRSAKYRGGNSGCEWNVTKEQVPA